MKTIKSDEVCECEYGSHCWIVYTKNGTIPPPKTVVIYDIKRDIYLEQKFVVKNETQARQTRKKQKDNRMGKN